MRLPVSELNRWPSVDEAKVDELLLKEIADNDQKIVVLDDDPTGVQTVHDISVYTDWSLESVTAGFNEANKVFYILTNSRGMTVDETTKAHREMAENIAAAAKATGKDYMIMSRSDSTLRGHYPLEPQLLKEGMEADGKPIDGEVMCPFFKEGGRFTISNIHYVKQGDELVPAAETVPSATPIPRSRNMSRRRPPVNIKQKMSPASRWRICVRSTMRRSRNSCLRSMISTRSVSMRSTTAISKYLRRPSTVR